MPPKCRCGSGDMKLFTSHTKSNPNRKFWRCIRWNVSVLTCHAECAHFHFFYLFKTCLRQILMKTFVGWNLYGKTKPIEKKLLNQVQCHVKKMIKMENCRIWQYSSQTWSLLLRCTIDCCMQQLKRKKEKKKLGSLNNLLVQNPPCNIVCHVF